MVVSTSTGSALPAADQRHDRHEIAGRDRVHPGGDLEHRRGELMTEDLRSGGPGQWMRIDRDDDGTVGVLVQVGTADTAIDRAYTNLARLERAGGRNVLNADVPASMEGCCAHVNSNVKPPGSAASLLTDVER